MTSEQYHVFVSAAEPSGDMHAAEMIRALHKRIPNLRVVGVGGPKMEAAGCELLANPVDRAAMLLGAVKEIFFFYGIFRKIKKHLRNNKVDLVIVCDSPAFNFHVAKAGKRAGIPTLFYVAPQLWAWAGWRIHKLRRCCDKLCCILPFEEEWFRSRGVDATYVSNPLLDPVDTDLETHVKSYEDYRPDAVRLALMPGSRGHEIESLWQPMQEIALRVKAKYPEASFMAVTPTEERKQALQTAEIPGFECDYVLDSVHNTARQVDLTLVASGSATLEVAAAGCPMVIMYKANPWTIRLLGWLVKTKFYSLVNLVANKRLVPEFMPTFDSIDPLVESTLKLAGAPHDLATMSRDLIDLTKPLAKQKTHDAVADTALSMLTGKALPAS